jgi:AP-3 complex subunit mu
MKASASPAAPPSTTVSPSSESEAAIQPVIATSKYNLVHVKRNNLYLLAVLLHDSSPLLVIEFLNRAADVFKDYFSGLTEELLKDNFVTVYQLLDEMCDGGNVMTLEPNMLWEMIGVPSLLSGTHPPPIHTYLHTLTLMLTPSLPF